MGPLINIKKPPKSFDFQDIYREPRLISFVKTEGHRVLIALLAHKEDNISIKERCFLTKFLRRAKTSLTKGQGHLQELDVKIFTFRV